MSMNLQYKYAVVRADTGECVNVCTSTHEIDDPCYIPIETLNFDYEGKFYVNGEWYEDAAGTIPWSPAE